jgi:hypothetical protein
MKLNVQPKGYLAIADGRWAMGEEHKKLNAKSQ